MLKASYNPFAMPDDTLNLVEQVEEDDDIILID